MLNQSLDRKTMIQSSRPYTLTIPPMSRIWSISEDVSWPGEDAEIGVSQSGYLSSFPTSSNCWLSVGPGGSRGYEWLWYWFCVAKFCNEKSLHWNLHCLRWESWKQNRRLRLDKVPPIISCRLYPTCALLLSDVYFLRASHSPCSWGTFQYLSALRMSYWTPISSHVWPTSEPVELSTTPIWPTAFPHSELKQRQTKCQQNLLHEMHESLWKLLEVASSCLCEQESFRNSLSYQWSLPCAILGVADVLSSTRRNSSSKMRPWFRVQVCKLQLGPVWSS